jgi:hypothetical protein
MDPPAQVTPARNNSRNFTNPQLQECSDDLFTWSAPNESPQPFSTQCQCFLKPASHGYSTLPHPTLLLSDNERLCSASAGLCALLLHICSVSAWLCALLVHMCSANAVLCALLVHMCSASAVLYALLVHMCSASAGL